MSSIDYKKVKEYCRNMRKNKDNCYTDNGYNKKRFISRREARKIVYKIASSNDKQTFSTYANTNNSTFARKAKRDKKMFSKY